MKQEVSVAQIYQTYTFSSTLQLFLHYLSSL